jgi:hypothetical protein
VASLSREINEVLARELGMGKADRRCGSIRRR